VEVIQALKTFKAYVENQSGYYIKALCDDKGGEYMSNKFDQFTMSGGIACQHTILNQLQQNEVTEKAT